MDNKPTFKVGYIILPDTTPLKEFKFFSGSESNDFNIIRCREWLKSTPNDSAYKKVPERYTTDEDSLQILVDYLDPSFPEILEGKKLIENDKCILEIV